MKSISSIKWTENSVNHIVKHAVTPKEVEEVCFNEEESPLVRSGRENLHYVFGKTYSGRYLFVVVRFVRPGEVRIITTRDMNAWEKKYFKKRGK
ncbi:MAG: BrnT family toxin [Pseudomonadota bacterium]